MAKVAGVGKDPQRPPVALSIAGSDPSGGAGIQGDLKTFSALGAYGTAVITALTAQNTREVSGIRLVPADFVAQQLRTLVADVRVDAIKIGMLGTAELADTVAVFLAEHPYEIVVLDPVMVATSGDRLLDAGGVEALHRLLPLVSLVTPNLPEAARLLGSEVAGNVGQMRDQASRLMDAGAVRVLLKGGHHESDGDAVDVFTGPEGERVLRSARVATRNTHGTGCALASAVAALRPQRAGWVEAVSAAKTWLTEALGAADALHVGEGSGPVHHLHELWGR